MIDVNLVLSLPPSPFTVAMIASAIPAAIRSYSIAIAPDSVGEEILRDLFHYPGFLSIFQERSTRGNEFGLIAFAASDFCCTDSAPAAGTFRASG